jgi:hypothetical protein
MSNRQNQKPASENAVSVKRSGALNSALIFGVAAIAITLIVTPFLAKHDAPELQAVAPSLYDNITTGSITSSGETSKRYIIRRSLLQQTPGAVCIINSDGSSSGC